MKHPGLADAGEWSIATSELVQDPGEHGCRDRHAQEQHAAVGNGEQQSCAGLASHERERRCTVVKLNSPGQSHALGDNSDNNAPYVPQIDLEAWGKREGRVIDASAAHMRPLGLSGAVAIRGRRCGSRSGGHTGTLGRPAGQQDGQEASWGMQERAHTGPKDLQTRGAYLTF